MFGTTPRMASRANIAGVLVMLAACSGDGSPDPDAPRLLPFGPFEVAPLEERENVCVQISLDNAEPMFVNAVELTTGPGFHHSNWFFVPDHVFAGPDGVWPCEERNFNEPVAAIFGGVLFAQSTQTTTELQQFPAGVAIKLPPKAKLIANVHLLNPGDQTLTLRPTIEVTPIPEREVTTLLSGVSFETKALALPPNMRSKFTVECDLAERHNFIFGRDPDFALYYALAHYHALGTALTLEAVKPDGASALIYSTANAVGDKLGGPLEPVFSMQGYTKLRMSCEYYNPRPEVVGYGIGDQEMCVVLAFSDSPYNWGGGVNTMDAPENPKMEGNMITYSNPCSVYANDARR